MILSTVYLSELSPSWFIRWEESRSFWKLLDKKQMTSLETEMKHAGVRVNLEIIFLNELEYNKIQKLRCIVTIIKVELWLN